VTGRVSNGKELGVAIWCRPASMSRIYTAVRSGDFLADEKIAWRDAYAAQMRAAIRPLQQAAD